MSGSFKDQDILQSLSLFISMCTIEWCPLNILKRLNKIVVIQPFQDRILIQQVAALVFAWSFDRLDNKTLLFGSIKVNLRVGSGANHLQIWMCDFHKQIYILNKEISLLLNESNNNFY